MTIDLSTLFDIRKDTLYCDPTSSLDFAPAAGSRHNVYLPDALAGPDFVLHNRRSVAIALPRRRQFCAS